MDIGAIRNSPEEQERHRRFNLCYQCGKDGHMAKDCPEKERNPFRGRRFTPRTNSQMQGNRNPFRQPTKVAEVKEAPKSLAPLSVEEKASQIAALLGGSESENEAVKAELLKKGFH